MNNIGTAEVRKKAFAFVFIFSSFCPETMQRLQRKRNKWRGKSGFIFSYFCFTEAAAPQFLQTHSQFIPGLTEQCRKISQQKLLLGLCKAAALSRSSCNTFYAMLSPQISPGVPPAPLTLGIAQREGSEMQLPERQAGIPSVFGSLRGVQCLLKV